MLRTEVSNNIDLLSQYIGEEQEVLIKDSFRIIFRPKINTCDRKEELWDNVWIQNISKIMNLNQKILKKKSIFNSPDFNKNSHGREIRQLCKSIIIKVLSEEISKQGPKSKKFSEEACRIVSAKEMSL